MTEPEYQAEEKGVEVDGDDSGSGEVEQLAPQLVLVRLPEKYKVGKKAKGKNKTYMSQQCISTHLW